MEVSMPEKLEEVDAASGAEALLLEFLRDHDAECPLCGYNLRALTRPVCPECKQDLVLTVGVRRLQLGWLFAAVAPGFFSGIAAVFVTIPVVGRLFFGDGVVMWLMLAMDVFGFCSLAGAILLVRRRVRFLALSAVGQRWAAIAIWVVHIAALGLFFLLATTYL